MASEALYRATVSALSPDGGVYVEVSSLGAGTQFGPCEAANFPVSPGDRVLVGVIGGVREDVVIVAPLYSYGSTPGSATASYGGYGGGYGAAGSAARVGVTRPGAGGYGSYGSYVGAGSGAVASTAISGSTTSGGAFTPRGVWASGVSYSAGDVVNLAGSSFVAGAATATAAPPAAPWQLLAAKGDPGSPGTPGTPGSSGTTVHNWRASNTRRVKASLGRAMSGGLAHHAFLGDSETGYFVGTGADQLGMWPRVYRSTLAALGVPIGGTGFVPAANAGPGPFDSRWTFTNWTNANEYRASTATGAGAVFTSDTAGTGVRVAYLDTSAAFTVSIDGAAPVAPPIGGSSTVRSYAVTGLANTTHTVTVTATAASPPTYLIGASVTAASGLVCHNLGRFGATASGSGAGAWSDVSSFVNVNRAWVGSLPATPDVVWLALGVNDVINAVPTATITAALSTLRGQFASSDVILVAQYEPQGQAAWPAYIQALYALADTLDVPLLDLYDRSGGYTAANGNGLMGDTTHPNSAAQRDWGRAAALLVAA